MKNNTTRNLETLTYAELKNLVPETPKGKMPTPKKLETEEVLFTERIDGADITVLKNGYVIYTVTDDNGKPHRTVYSVHRCSRIVFPVNFSKEERDDAWDCKAIADEVAFRMIDGRLMKLHIIKEDRYLDGPWWFPITVVCEERMRHNQSSREEYKSDFSMDGDYEGEDGEETSENWNPELSCDPINDWIEAEDKKEKDEQNHRKLMEGLKSLTEIQRRTVDLYYSNPGITERAVAKELGVDQSTVHRNLQAALKKLRKFF